MPELDIQDKGVAKLSIEQDDNEGGDGDHSVITQSYTTIQPAITIDAVFLPPQNFSLASHIVDKASIRAPPIPSI